MRHIVQNTLTKRWTRMNEQELVALIEKNAPNLKIPDHINKKRLMWAFASNETDLGRMELRSRFEPSYSGNWHRSFYKEGKSMFSRSNLAMTAWRKWGDSAAQSYGLFQIMYTTAIDTGVISIETPPEELRKTEVNVAVFIALINRIVRGNKDITVEQIADAYNSGSYKDNIVPKEYITKLKKAYDRASI